ncbi:hypothetical protein CQA49_09355 [Helicobacter sp. MIT 00-7814]|nr:hypothetical protein CQA49_09355 [Helicobacter sp. MIT 00-7814]RDU51679.1 hypothetical protein CQA37_09465 [Helicobacter sp. MIT 99-10781]
MCKKFYLLALFADSLQNFRSRTPKCAPLKFCSKTTKIAQNLEFFKWHALRTTNRQNQPSTKKF